MTVVDTGLLTAGVRSEFLNRFKPADDKAHYQTLATRIDSNSNSESYRWLGSLPRMREWGTGRVAKGIRAESYDVENLRYESTIEIDRSEIADERTGQIAVRIGELALRAATHKDYLISQLLANGETSGFNSYDGVSFFNDAHVSGASGSQDNLLGASAVDAANPTTDEFKAALKAAIAAMLGFKDDVGDPMSLSADGLVVVVPTTHYFAAMEAVNATVISSTSNVLAGMAKVVAFPWLSATDTWYLAKTDGVVRPFVFQDREPVEFTSLVEDSEPGFMREVFLYGVRARYRLTYGYWQFCVRSKFS